MQQRTIQVPIFDRPHVPATTPGIVGAPLEDVVVKALTPLGRTRQTVASFVPGLLQLSGKVLLLTLLICLAGEGVPKVADAVTVAYEGVAHSAYVDFLPGDKNGVHT